MKTGAVIWARRKVARKSRDLVARDAGIPLDRLTQLEHASQCHHIDMIIALDKELRFSDLERGIIAGNAIEYLESRIAEWKRFADRGSK